MYEELVEAFGAYDIEWAADRDAGAKYRPRTDGTDYYGILRRSAGVPAVLSEAAFISNPAEEALLADPAFQRVEAKALTEAIVRFATTDDPGSGFVTPYPTDRTGRARRRPRRLRGPAARLTRRRRPRRRRQAGGRWWRRRPSPGGAGAAGGIGGFHGASGSALGCRGAGPPVRRPGPGGRLGARRARRR